MVKKNPGNPDKILSNPGSNCRLHPPTYPGIPVYHRCHDNHNHVDFAPEEGYKKDSRLFSIWIFQIRQRLIGNCGASFDQSVPAGLSNPTLLLNMPIQAGHRLVEAEINVILTHERASGFFILDMPLEF